MKELPEGLTPYRRTPVFTEETVPAGLLRDHQTKAGVWGVIEVSAGRLRYTIPSSGEVVELHAGLKGIVEPEVPHHVTPLGEVTFSVEFWR
ncbi:MAG: DUF1971 domain-containing protein [Pseudomonadota bacterium]